MHGEFINKERKKLHCMKRERWKSALIWALVDFIVKCDCTRYDMILANRFLFVSMLRVKFSTVMKTKKIPFILVLQESSLDDLSPSLIIQIRLFWNISKDWSLKSIATTISFKKARCRSAIASRVLLELCRPSGVGRWTVELLEHRSLSAGKHSGVRADLDCVEKAFGEAFERRLNKKS